MLESHGLCSRALEVPNRSLWKQKLTIGVMKVVRRSEYYDRYCELASNFENTLAPTSWASVLSTLGVDKFRSSGYAKFAHFLMYCHHSVHHGVL